MAGKSIANNDASKATKRPARQRTQKRVFSPPPEHKQDTKRARTAATPKSVEEKSIVRDIKIPKRRATRNSDATALTLERIQKTSLIETSLSTPIAETKVNNDGKVFKTPLPPRKRNLVVTQDSEAKSSGRVTSSKRRPRVPKKETEKIISFWSHGGETAGVEADNTHFTDSYEDAFEKLLGDWKPTVSCAAADLSVKTPNELTASTENSNLEVLSDIVFKHAKSETDLEVDAEDFGIQSTTGGAEQDEYWYDEQEVAEAVESVLNHIWDSEAQSLMGEVAREMAASRVLEEMKEIIFGVEKTVEVLVNEVEKEDLLCASTDVLKFLVETVATRLEDEERHEQAAATLVESIDIVIAVEDTVTSIANQVVISDIRSAAEAVMHSVCECVATTIEAEEDEERKNAASQILTEMIDIIVGAEEFVGDLIDKTEDVDTREASQEVLTFITQSVEATLIKKAFEAAIVRSLVEEVMSIITEVKDAAIYMLFKVADEDASNAAVSIVNFVCGSVETTLTEEAEDEERKLEVRNVVTEIIETTVQVEDSMFSILHNVVDRDAECAAGSVMDFVCTSVEATLVEEKEHEHQVLCLLSDVIDDVVVEVDFQYTHAIIDDMSDDELENEDEIMEIDSNVASSSVDENFNKINRKQKPVDNGPEMDDDQFVLTFLKEMIMCTLHNNYLCSPAGSIENEQKDVAAGIDRFLSKEYSLNEKVQLSILNQVMDQWLHRKIEMVVLSL